jgi:hypothetical protein
MDTGSILVADRIEKILGHRGPRPTIDPALRNDPATAPRQPADWAVITSGLIGRKDVSYGECGESAWDCAIQPRPVIRLRYNGRDGCPACGPRSPSGRGLQRHDVRGRIGREWSSRHCSSHCEGACLVLQWCSETRSHCGAIHDAKSPEDGAGRSSGQERVWGQRRVAHSDARRVVGGIGDRGSDKASRILARACTSRDEACRSRILHRVDVWGRSPTGRGPSAEALGNHPSGSRAVAWPGG